MSRLDECFAALRARGERALIPFVTAGDPDLGTTAELVLALADAGADAIELGVPFSDPLADGPTIQRASERALRSGASLRRVLELVKGLRPRTEIPVILMGYANSFYTLGADAFAEGAREAGVDGLICIDLPPEEGEDLLGAARRCGIDPVLLAAPTTRPERLAMLADQTQGFLYYVSLTGVTSARARVGRGVEAAVRRVREISEIPVCVGFGVSKPEHAAEIGAYADGVVVGSALIDRLERASSRESAIADAAAFVAALKQPLRARP